MQEIEGCEGGEGGEWRWLVGKTGGENVEMKAVLSLFWAVFLVVMMVMNYKKHFSWSFFYFF